MRVACNHKLIGKTAFLSRPHIKTDKFLLFPFTSRPVGGGCRGLGWDPPFLLIGSPLKVWLYVKSFSSDDLMTVFVIFYALLFGFS